MTVPPGRVSAAGVAVPRTGRPGVPVARAWPPAAPAWSSRAIGRDHRALAARCARRRRCSGVMRRPPTACSCRSHSPLSGAASASFSAVRPGRGHPRCRARRRGPGRLLPVPRRSRHPRTPDLRPLLRPVECLGYATDAVLPAEVVALHTHNSLGRFRTPTPGPTSKSASRTTSRSPSVIPSSPGKGPSWQPCRAARYSRGTSLKHYRGAGGFG
jgi:hypothetical protein